MGSEYLINLFLLGRSLIDRKTGVIGNGRIESVVCGGGILTRVMSSHRGMYVQELILAREPNWRGDIKMELFNLLAAICLFFGEFTSDSI